MALFWWFGGCTFAMLIHSSGSLYTAKSYEICRKKTSKIIIKIPSRCHQNAGNGLQKSKFSWGACPQPPLDGRAYSAWCAFGTRRAYGTLSPPFTKVPIRPCLTWSLRRRLNSLGTVFLHRILGYHWSDFVSNDRLLRETGMRHYLHHTWAANCACWSCGWLQQCWHSLSDSFLEGFSWAGQMEKTSTVQLAAAGGHWLQGV